MTRSQKYPNAISNHFDELFLGIGHRGSSFTDIDGLIHDGSTNRFLMMEFKNTNEKLAPAQAWALREFAKQPGCWSLAIWHNGGDEYRVIYYPVEAEDLLGGKALRAVIADWWNQKTNIGNINYDYQRLLDLSKAYLTAVNGNSTAGIKPDATEAARLKIALLIFVESAGRLSRKQSKEVA